MMKEPSYYTANKLTPPKSFFNWCFSQIPIFKWSNKNETILSSNRKDCPIFEQKLRKNSRLTFFEKLRVFGIILVTSKRIEIQSYAFWSSVEAGKEKIEFELVNFEQFAGGKHVQVASSYGKTWFGLISVYGGMSGGPYSTIDLFKNDWKEKIRTKSELKYLEIPRLEFGEIETMYKYRVEIEFLQKIKARQLAKEVMYPITQYTNGSFRKTVDMRTINARWLKENKPFFKNSDKGFMEFELARRIKQRRGKVVPGIEEYLDYRDINKIPEGVGIVRFQNWVIKNKVDFSFYLDYLNLTRDLNIATDSENIIMPKNLVTAHDNAVKLLYQMKHEIEEQKYKARFEKIKSFEKVIDDYAFVVPKLASELIKEGKSLSHCVGGSSYVKQHIEGKSTIIFIRDKNDLEKSFYTLEYKNGHIVQLRGKHNCAPPEKVKKAADKWTKSLKRKTKELKLA
ncbi:PcfJ domain-containing protein [Listeria monocytogenes]|nr:PcfJ domain-containing protein [Listeria monocytogenes]EJN2365851.1 PcfJ domain-containing protein [Listeria monocytogenes]